MPSPGDAQRLMQALLTSQTGAAGGKPLLQNPSKE
jgi:hypothetical protein